MKIIGLMSGTSLDGIDAAIIDTDGEKIFGYGESLFLPYDNEFKTKVKKLFTDLNNLLEVEDELTKLHADAVDKLLIKANLKYSNIDLIGFHGQTIIHKPELGLTLQIGNGSLLAELTKINVICDFRRKDMARGGQGAPLIPMYHDAICKNLEKPIALINIGGVANITYLGKNDEIIAFDTGPGNALIDDVTYKNTGQSYDVDGTIASSGHVDYNIINELLKLEYFTKNYPKSLDRNEFNNVNLGHLSFIDQVATLTAFTAYSIKIALNIIPEPPKKWLISGGGRKNKFLMKILSDILPNIVEKVDNIADGDFIEAQGFAYLAARSYLGLSISLPSTTGIIHPSTGGAFYRA